VAGVGSASPVFWSQADTSQSAAIVDGSAPPMTKPKNRPEPIAVMPGSSEAASSSTTATGSEGPSGTGASSTACISRYVRSGATGRVSSDSR
jgi:hypothetical protein